MKERSPRIISLLLDKGAEINFVNSKGYTPLHTGTHKVLWIALYNYSRMFFTAVTLCYYEAVKILLEGGADPNICNAVGAPPLHTAFCVAFSKKSSIIPAGQECSNLPSREHLSELIIRELLNHGAETDLGGGGHYTFIKTALYGSNPAILAMILKKAPPESIDGIFHSEKADLLVFLLNLRRQPQAQFNDLKDLLDIFIGNLKTAENKHTIDVNSLSRGRTPVHGLLLSSLFSVVKASQKDEPIPNRSLMIERELVIHLFSHGASLNIPDHTSHFTPLTSAGKFTSHPVQTWFPASDSV